MGKAEYLCGACKIYACRTGNEEKMPKNCPSLGESVDAIKKMYTEDDLFLAKNSALVEAEGYCKKTRVEEVMDFARKCGFKNIGVAFCVGLHKEMAILNKILEANGFTVNSIACKNGSVPKEELLMISEKEKIKPCAFEAMCNPIGQAVYLNKAKTDFNLIFGLCVGHDTLFLRYAEAPVTVMAVKDRVLGHNPVAALYMAEGYYKKKLFPDEG